MNLSVKPRLAHRAVSHARRRLGREGGFTLIEAVLAMAIFATVSIALAGVLTSSITARSLASDRTAAEQEANDQIEWIRTIDYADVGVPGGNPKGIVNPTGDQSAQGGPTVPAKYTVSVTVKWVNDPTPTSYASKANYKNVTVTVLSASSGKQLSQQSTQIGPRQRAPFGGIDKGTVIVTVQDYLPPNDPDPGILVNLTTGPSATLSDTTDGAGQITFPSLDPTPSSGPTAFYDLVVPGSAGYLVYPLPLSTTHFSIAAAQTLQKTLQIYKPVTLTFQPQNSDGTPFSSAATFTVTGPAGPNVMTGTFTYNPATGAAITVTALTKSATSIQLPPGSYTITPASGMYADPVTLNVPEDLGDYPGDLTGQANVTSDALGSLRVAVSSAGSPVVGATVTVAGGPRSIAPAQSATTDSSGIATFAGLPAGSGYTVTASKGGQSAPNQTASVSGGTTTNVTMNFPTGSLKAVVTWATLPVVGATVALTGGPTGVNVSGTSDVNGEVLFSNIPAGSGYTINASRNGQNGTATSAVTAGVTTTVSVAMPVVTVVATVQWAGAAVSGATVGLSSGPMSLSTISGGPTPSSGQVTFSNIPAGTSYTLVGSKNGQSTTLANVTITTSPTTNKTIDLPTATLTITVTWAGQPAASATVTVSGGPNSPVTYSGSTNSSGVATITVPTSTTTYPYTVTVTKGAGSGSGGVSQVPSGGNSTSVALTQTGTFAATVTWGGTAVAGATVGVTGGPNAGVTYSSAPTSAAGTASILVPSGSGYTVSTTVSGQTATVTSQSVTTGGNQPVALALPTGTVAVNVKRSGTNQNLATVVLSGGPMGISVTQSTNSSGNTTFTNVPVGSGYTLSAYKCSVSNPKAYKNTAFSVASGSNSANVSFNVNTCPP